jgi:hypothetical protein
MHYLASALDGGEWSASRPGRFTPKEKAPYIHCIGGWMSPRTIMDVVVTILELILKKHLFWNVD